MTMKYGSYKIAALLVVLCAILTLSFERISTRSPSRGETPGLPAPSSSEVPRPEIATAPALATANAPARGHAPAASSYYSLRGAEKSQSLVTELGSAKDWRVFALNARSRPGEGGYFYAMYVTNLCSRKIVNMPDLGRDAISTAVRKTSTVTSTMTAMIERFSARCASFSAGEASELYQMIKQISSDQRDPVVNAASNLSVALSLRDRDRAKASLSELLDRGDPLPLYKDAVLLRVLSFGTANSASGETWLDGKSYVRSSAEEFSTLMLAIDLAACGGEVHCEVDESMMLGCIGGQYCTSSREDYLRHQYISQGGMAEQSFARAVALSARIREIIANRQVEALMR